MIEATTKDKPNKRAAQRRRVVREALAEAPTQAPPEMKSGLVKAARVSDEAFPVKMPDASTAPDVARTRRAKRKEVLRPVYEIGTISKLLEDTKKREARAADAASTPVTTQPPVETSEASTAAAPDVARTLEEAASRPLPEFATTGRTVVHGLDPIPKQGFDEIRMFRVVDPRRVARSTLNVKHREPDEGLVESLRKHGVIEPLIVRPIERDDIVDAHGERTVDLELVVGSRRFSGVWLAGLRMIPVEIRVLDDREAFDLAVAENLDREDLSPMQEAQLCEEHRARFGRDLDEIAAHMSRGRRWVEQRLALCKLPEEGQALVHERRMLLGVALEVAALPEDLRAEAIRLVRVAEGVPPIAIADARELLAPFVQRMSDAPFDVKDPQLIAAAGPCTTCPNRSGNQLVLQFDGVEAVDRCLDRACWGRKVEAAWQARAAAAEERGVHVLDTKAGGDIGTAARTLLAQHRARGFLDLDAVCDVAGDALLGPLHEAMADAMAAKDQEKIDAVDEALTKAEREADGLTWRKVLGEEVKPAALVRDGRSGRDVVVELVDESHALRALQARGIELSHASKPAAEARDDIAPAPAPPAPSWLVDEHTTRLLVVRIAERMVPLAEKARPWADARLWRALIVVLGSLLPPASLAALCARRGWKQARSKGQTIRDVFEANVVTLRDRALRGLLVEVCSSTSHVHALTLAEVFELDVGALHKACEADAKKASIASGSPKRTARGGAAA